MSQSKNDSLGTGLHIKKKKVPLIFLDFYKANGRCDGRGENRKFLPRLSHQKNELENFK